MATRIVVSGRVQGVSFRAYARAEAIRLGLRGWVRNRADGTVEALAAGPGETAFVEWCHRGSPAAQVDQVRAEPAADPGVQGFEILR